MRLIIRLIIQALLIILLFACSSSNSDNNNSYIDDKIGIVSQTLEESESKSTTNNRTFIVSFFSKGSGIDNKTKTAFLELIDGINNHNSKKIIFTEKKWGREGEVDYCMNFDEFDISNATELKDKIKELINIKKLVKIYEDRECR